MIDPRSQRDTLLAFSWHFFCQVKLSCLFVKCFSACVLGREFAGNHKCVIFVLNLFSLLYKSHLIPATDTSASFCVQPLVPPPTHVYIYRHICTSSVFLVSVIKSRLNFFQKILVAIVSQRNRSSMQVNIYIYIYGKFVAFLPLF